MKTIALFYDRKKPQAEAFALEAAEWLRRKGHKVFVKPNKRVLKNNRIDFAISFGGDGTVFHTANIIVEKKTPLLRVNFGTEGFLTNIEPQDFYDKMIRALDEKDYTNHKKTRIEVLVYDKDNNLLLQKDALNDVVIERTDVMVVHWTVEVDGEKLDFVGDSLIVASPTGSTAYHESAGGRVIVRQDKIGLVISASSDRYGESRKVKSSSVTFNIFTKGKARLNIDGRKALRKTEGLRIEIKKSERFTVFMEIGDAPRMEGD